MLLFKKAITQLAERGKKTLQVPHVSYGVSSPDDFEEFPDEWFIFLNGNRPAIGRECGCLFLTREGWNANKDKIKQAFEGAENRTGYGTWEDFELKAKEHFEKIENGTKKFLDDLSKKSKQIKEAMKKL